MGHGSEKKSHKHKHRHHKQKHSHKDRKRERADGGEQKLKALLPENVEKLTQDSEPESGEIVEVVVEKAFGSDAIENGVQDEAGKIDVPENGEQAHPEKCETDASKDRSAGEEDLGDRDAMPVDDRVDLLPVQNGEADLDHCENADDDAKQHTSRGRSGEPRGSGSDDSPLHSRKNNDNNHAPGQSNGNVRPGRSPSPLKENKNKRRKQRRRSRSGTPPANRSRSLSRDAHRRKSRRRDVSRSRSSDRARELERRDRERERERERYHRRDRSPGDDFTRIERRRGGGEMDERRESRGYEYARRRSRSRDERKWRHGKHRDSDRHRHRRYRSTDRKKRRRSKDRANSDQEDEEYAARIVAALEQNEEDEDRLIEERRKRRQEILNKYKKQEANKQEDTEKQEDAMEEDSPQGQSPAVEPASNSSPSSVPSVQNPLLSATPEQGMPDFDQPANNSQPPQDKSSEEQAEVAEPDTNGGEKQADPAEDVDIFCDTPDRPSCIADGLDEAVRKATVHKGLTDAYDDPEGYYNFQIGEILDSRYEVFASKGKGVFSTVLRAKDRSRRGEDGEHPEVAIKIIRSNDVMKKSGQMEEHLLKKLAATDKENKRHCIRLLRSFEYRGHLCLVFEPMAMNLRELINKFGRKVGLNIDAVGRYTFQLLVALKHLKNNKILHADIKPDNILVNEKYSRVKLCDFGSAMLQGDVEVTPYLVSRFYRSPEIILGLPYDHPMDLWSIGCVVYEMFTGKILYPGKTNNQMLQVMMAVKGAFPRKMLKKGEFADRHFENDPNMSFTQFDEDPVTKKPIKRLIVNPTVKNDFAKLLLKNEGDSNRKLTLQLADLLEKMMMLDPERRIDVDAALAHPFVKSCLQRARTAADAQRKDTKK